MAFNIEDIIEERKRREEYYRNYAKAHPEQYESSRKLDEWVKSKQAQGEIVDPTLQNWLNGEIAAARIALAVGMMLTVLIKGQIVIWIILYIAYRGRVNKAKREAFEEDKRRSCHERMD